MKKTLRSLFFGIVLFFASVGLVSAQNATSTPSAVPVVADSFEMFWPISAGKVSGEFLYKLKLAKEGLRGGLIFSDYRKADYNITLSVKRVVEAEKLYLNTKKYDHGKKTLTAAQQKRQKAYDLIMKASGKGQNVTDIKNAFKSSLEKQTILLTYIMSQVPDGEKEAINNDLKAIQELLSKLQ